MKRAHLSLTVLFATIIGGALVVACEGDDPQEQPSVDGGQVAPDGSTPGLDSSTPNDGSTAPADAGVDGEVFGDGGGLPPEDDGGTTDLDGGFDAGPACEVLTTGAFIKTACASLSAIPGGGALTTTNYVLQQVTVLGSSKFCVNTYVPYDHRGALRVTASSPTTASFEFVDQYRKSATLGGITVRPTSVRYDVTVASSGTQLTYTPEACAAKPAPASALYTVSAAAGGKKQLKLRLPYGTGSADYTFVEP